MAPSDAERVYRAEAMDLLRQAVTKGHKDAAQERHRPRPIRNREDFKKLIAQLAAASKKKGGLP